MLFKMQRKGLDHDRAEAAMKSLVGIHPD